MQFSQPSFLGNTAMIHALPPNHPSMQSGEYSLALSWYNSLTLAQMDFLSAYYKVPVSASDYAILSAFRDRDATHNHPDWPAPILRSI